MMAIGNDVMNSVFEGSTNGRQKPSPMSPRFVQKTFCFIALAFVMDRILFYDFTTGISGGESTGEFLLLLISAWFSDEKDTWIRCKYEQREFLPSLPYPDIPLPQVTQ